MATVKKGQKVRLADDFPPGTGARSQFTVVKVFPADEEHAGKRVALEGSTKMTSGHECDGLVEPGRGWWAHPDNIISTEDDESDDE